jgi:hypothetical protein
MISAPNTQGLVRFAFFNGAIDAERSIESKGGLPDNARRIVFLIVDDLLVYHAKIVEEWPKDKTEVFDSFDLLSYSPEANPDEMLNRDLKTAPQTRHVVHTVNELTDPAIRFMVKLRSMPEGFNNNLKSRSIAYAADRLSQCPLSLPV